MAKTAQANKKQQKQKPQMKKSPKFRDNWRVMNEFTTPKRGKTDFNNVPHFQIPMGKANYDPFMAHGFGDWEHMDLNLDDGFGFGGRATGSEQVMTPSGVEYTCPKGDQDCIDEVMAIDRLAAEFDLDFVNRAFEHGLLTELA